MNEVKKIITTERSKVRTLAKRASYDFETITKILDDTFLCHIGFVIHNQVYVIPTCYGRDGDKIYFHGAKGSRMLKHIKTGVGICVSITNLDGIVLARSAFHHSINYRSVIIFGKADELTDSTVKNDALKIITEHIIPGRWKDVRKPSEKELNATSVFSLKINEASAKIRTGGPLDEDVDYSLNIWAGVIPIKAIRERPIKDEKADEKISLPDYLFNY